MKPPLPRAATRESEGVTMATATEKLSEYIAVYKAAAALHKSPAAVKAKIDEGLVKAIRRGSCGLLVRVADVEQAFLLDVHRAEARVVRPARRRFASVPLNPGVKC